MSTCLQWHIGHYAYLIDKLKNTPEVAGRAGGLAPGLHIASAQAHPGQVLLSAMQAVGYRKNTFGEVPERCPSCSADGTTATGPKGLYRTARLGFAIALFHCHRWARWGPMGCPMDVPAIEALYRQYGNLVLGRARRLLGDEQAAADALQEVFVRVVRGHDAFRRDASPVTWLYRITTNYCLNLLRDAGRRERRTGAQAPATAGGTDVGGAFERASPVYGDPLPELRLTIAQIVAHVSEELWEIAVYHYVDAMNHEEIARTMGVSRRTIGNRLKEFQCQAQALLQLPSEIVA